MYTKGQMMLETVIVILIVIGLFIVGVVFYATNLQSSISKGKLEERDLRGNVLLNRVLNLPELQCSKQNIVDDNCLDESKLENFKDILESDNDIFNYYTGVFGKSKITVKIIDPFKSDIEIFSYGESENKIVKEVPVLINLEKRNAIGLLRIEVFE